MGTYATVRDNFSSRPQYSIDLTITTAYVSGGTQVTVGNQAVKHTEVSNAPFSSGSPRSYSTPNGRAGSVTGNLAESGSDSNWAFSFTYPGVPQYQHVWGAGGFFTRFYPDSVSIGTISISASHSLLGNATASRSGIKHVYRTSFDGNGGSAGTSFTDADSGSSITLPSASRSGYNFDGWYTAASGGTFRGGAGSSYTVNSTDTLYAQWSLATITITFNYQGGSGSPSSKSITPGDQIGTLPSASLGTYNFVGWYYGVNGSGGQVSQFTTFNSNDTLYAYYESTVVFNANGGTGGTTIYVPKGNSVNPASYSAGTRSGYTFSSWSPFNSTFTPAGYTTLTAQWTALSVSWSDTTLSTTARKGVLYSDTISASYVNSWNDGILPSKNISLVQGTSTTGLSTSTVTGTPNDYGPLTFTLTPSNIDGVAGAAYTYTINIADEQIVWADQTIVNSLVIQGESYSDSVSVESGPTVTYSLLSGSLPDGVTLNSSTGAITGTVSASATPQVYDFVVRATNGTGETEDTATLSITVEAAGGYVKVWNGTQWLEGTAYVRAAGTWNEGTVKLRASGTWNDSFSS